MVALHDRRTAPRSTPCAPAPGRWGRLACLSVLLLAVGGAAVHLHPPTGSIADIGGLLVGAATASPRSPAPADDEEPDPAAGSTDSHGAITDPAREDPHGRSDACGSCHAPGEDPAAVGAPKPSGEACVPCHETSDMHPSNVLVQDAQVPQGWPLEGERLVCTTCHAEPACDGERSPRAPYLRGSPYEHGIEFCWSCHPANDYSRTDPHHPASPREPTDNSCAFCHHGVPEEGATAADARLRAEPTRLCQLCHAGAVHTGTASHLGVVVEADKRSALEPVLGLDSGGEIRCWTCHEVHGDRPPPASIEATKTAYTFSEMPGPDRLRQEESPPWLLPERDPAHPVLLPLDGGAICRACHGSGP